MKFILYMCIYLQNYLNITYIPSQNRIGILRIKPQLETAQQQTMSNNNKSAEKLPHSSVTPTEYIRLKCMLVVDVVRCEQDKNGRNPAKK